MLLKKDVSIALRLKMFDAVVTRTVLFGLVTLPFTQRQLFKLDRAQAYVEINHWLASQQCRRLACQHAANE